MSLVALDSYADFPNPKLYLGSLHTFVACGVYRNLEVAALLRTLECCTPKNLWRLIFIHGLKLIMAVGAGVAGQIAALTVGKVQEFTVLWPVPSKLGDSRSGTMREYDFFTATARASDRANYQACPLSFQITQICRKTGQC